ncbi:MAG: IS110 family transposase [Anaerolineae bacterium]
MRVIYERCCGLDVHKKSVTACIITPQATQTRAFGTMVRDLLDLADWLTEHQITHVAMESTGVYWKPVYNLLEEEFEVSVINARHIKSVPGRKTDVKDAEWIADLLRHGLIRGSFIPERAQRELRELVRYRRRLIQQRAQMVSRIQKVLEGGNIKLASVASDIVGASGLAMLRAMVGGEDDPETLATLAKGKLRDKIPELAWALRGTIGPHQRFMLDSQLRVLGLLDDEIAHLNEEVDQRVDPFEEAVQRIDEIPGIGRRGAQEILTEIGTDMSRFPSAAHLASWAKVSPSNNESGGKRKPGPTGKGNPWIKAALTEAAQSAAKKKNSYLAAQKRRLSGRRGTNRATMAVAHSILKSIYFMLRDGTTYRDLGANYFDQRRRHATVDRAVRRIERLGYKVSLEAL